MTGDRDGVYGAANAGRAGGLGGGLRKAVVIKLGESVLVEPGAYGQVARSIVRRLVRKRGFWLWFRLPSLLLAPGIRERESTGRYGWRPTRIP